MKKTIVLLLALLLLLLLTACGHTHTYSAADCLTPATCECGAVEGEALGHTYRDATCTAPKTCERCGATEGEAVGHKLSAATYQTAPVCSTCGETVGEKMQADFEKYGINKFLTEGQSGIFNTLNAKGTDSPVNVTVKSYEITKTDEERPEREGYEWHTVKFECVVRDSVALTNGFTIGYCYTDYYTIKAFRDSADHTDSTFSKLVVNFNGQEMPVWFGQAGGYEQNADGSVTFNYMVSVQKPIGYDGIVVGMNTGKYNLSTDPIYFNDAYNEAEFLLVRIKA